MKLYNTNFGILTEMQCKAKLANGAVIKYFKMAWKSEGKKIKVKKAL